MAFSKKALRARGLQRKERRSGSGGYGDVLRQGELAWGGGMSRDSNPHPPGSEDHEVWHEGWDDAKATMSKRRSSDD